jgi:hypothetical protein
MAGFPRWHYEPSKPSARCGRALGCFEDGLGGRPSGATPAKASEDLARANQALADALNRAKTPSPSPDLLWHVGDAMQSFSSKQPDCLLQAQEALKKFSPPSYNFAQQLQQTIQPAIGRSADAQSLLAAVGPKPTQPSSAQLFVLPKIKKLPFPEPIKTVQWPQTTKFVWPEPIKLPTLPTQFTWPGQEKT